MTRIIFVNILKNGKVKVYNENLDLEKEFNNSDEYRKWLLMDCQNCIRKRLN